MNITIQPSKLQGSVTVIPSKSQAHRYLICAALCDNETQLICPETNRDIEATVDCLNALGATIVRSGSGYSVSPIQKIPDSAVLNCCESGSTLRFMLSIVGALGVDAVFQLEGRLPRRPLSPLWEEMERMGCRLSRPSENTIRCEGKLKAGNYTISGSVSSQFITGLLFALSLVEGEAELFVTGKLESQPYVTMTEEAMQHFGAPHYHSPGTVTVEGDWSNGAFWVAAQMLGSSLSVVGLNPVSAQGDRAVVDIAHQLLECCPTISAADIPDLIPVLSVIAAANNGAVFTDIQRLRLKESDRVATVIEMIENLGGKAESTEDTLTVHGTALRGGTVDSHNDHRIAMSAAIAATVCTAPVTILGADAVKKSYPSFWEEYRNLGGHYEQHLR
jgi:3-phosphoshikimate 1-carboxyvinyltransferase